MPGQNNQAPANANSGGNQGNAGNQGGAGNQNNGNNSPQNNVHQTPQSNNRLSKVFGPPPPRFYSSLNPPSSLNQRLLNLSTPSEKLSQNRFGARQGSIQARAEESYLLQKSRMHITPDWKEAAVGKELEKIAQLQHFLEEERKRAAERADYFQAKEDEADMKQETAMLRQNHAKGDEARFKAQMRLERVHAKRMKNQDKWDAKIAKIQNKAAEKEEHAQELLREKEEEDRLRKEKRDRMHLEQQYNLEEKMSLKTQKREMAQRRIAMEDKLWQGRKAQEDEIKAQVKIMKEQLAMKKQQMMKELRSLRTDFQAQKQNRRKRNSVATMQQAYGNNSNFNTINNSNYGGSQNNNYNNSMKNNNYNNGNKSQR